MKGLNLLDMAIGVKTVWTPKMDQFLKDNYQVLTNIQLAEKLGLRLTITRNRLHDLGIKRIEMEYWTPEQISYLVDNFRTTGNVELALYFDSKWPKNKKWTKNHMAKKLGYLKLTRTPEEIAVLVAQNCGKGGRSYTIDRNSSSKNMHPMWVAQQIAWRNPELQREILKHPELIALKKQQLLLNREIKKQKNGTNY